MEAVTQWFDGDEKPVRIGVYQRQYGDGIRYCKWNGRIFNYSRTTAGEAGREVGASLIQSLPWRGLAEEPKK